MGIIREGGSETVVILDRNVPAFHAVPPSRYEAMQEILDDTCLAETVGTRRGGTTVRADIDDLLAQAGEANQIGAAAHSRRLRMQLAALPPPMAIDDMDIPGFRSHPLKGEMRGRWSIMVNGKSWLAMICGSLVST